MANFFRKKPWHLPDAQITSPEFYFSRRKFIQALGGAAGALSLSSCLSKSGEKILSGTGVGEGDIFDIQSPEGYPTLKEKWGLNPAPNSLFTGDRPQTDPLYPLNYNNYYEFTISKEFVAHLAKEFTPEPWTLRVHGLVNKELTYDLDDLVHLANLETRIYRHRCVEAWAMTVPWIGYPLHKLLAKASPKSQAKYVKFTSFYRPEEAPGQKEGGYTSYFPYYEGLTLAEAMNELTLLTFGQYDVVLPNQSGAPLRVVVPWKYGYKGPKAVVDIELVDTMPRTFWSDLVPSEYPFESNVNPNVPHPRWSQATERLLGPYPEEVVPTQKYNGYGNWVASLYE